VEACALNGYNIKWLDLRCTLNGYIYIPLIIVESYFCKWYVWRGRPCVPVSGDPKNAGAQARRERRESRQDQNSNSHKSYIIKNGNALK